MKNLEVLGFSVLVCMTVACNGNKASLESYLTPERNANLGKVILEKLDSVVCEVPENEYNSFTGIDENQDELYCHSILDPLKITVYDIAKGEHVKTIDYDPNLLRAREILSYQVLSRDSILLVTTPGSKVVLTDGEGKILERWSPDISEGELCGGGVHYDYLNSGKLCMVMCPGSRYSIEKSDPSVPRHWIYDMNTNDWYGKIAPLEGVLKYSEGLYYFDMMTPFHLVKDNLLYVTYMVDHSVYVYDINTGKLLVEKDISPEDAGVMVSPIETEIASYENLSGLRRRAASYGPLYYHEKCNLFSRVYKYSLEQRKGSGNHMEVCIYDDDFNIVGSEIIKTGYIDFIFPTQDGFVAVAKNNTDADSVKFIRYKIKSQIK